MRLNFRARVIMSSKRKELSTKDEKSCDKRTKGPGRHHINCLPEELLGMVFDRLCLESVKTASLVCRKWNEILFSGTYANRFVFRVDGGNNFCPERIVEAIHVLARSIRGYRRVFFKGGNQNDETEFQVDWNSSAKPILPSNSVKHLHVTSEFRIWVDMPNLETFDGHLTALHQHDENVPLPALTKLKHVTLRHYEDYSKSPELLTKIKESHPTAIRRLSNVESIKWKTHVSSQMFVALCETCTQVKDMLFHRSLSVDTMADLENLSKLTQLRSLKFKDACIMVNDNSSYDFDFSKQTNLVELDLYDTDMDTLKFPETLRSLAVYITAENEQTLIQSIVSAGSELTALKLRYRGSDFRSQEPTVTLKALPQLENLETLVFIWPHFKSTTFLCMDAPLYSVRKLHFEDCHLETEKFLGMNEKFPNLQEHKFLNMEWPPPFYSHSD
ncbi:uncharacterized protein LOC126574895 [Anopheles aquasalis]|uniref:uncharacterized protein LOC126574895 n=1 Tax=Anopheles aquasalis TaxID=42839 RepID=UPI00215AAD83|nr:uncharacterized protein LOC126574895 [Anopheles aquasalis]